MREEIDLIHQARLFAAADSASEMDLLRRLSASREPDIRLALAGNPSCPPDIITFLVNRGDYKEQQAAARNPATPPEVLRDLSGRSASIRAGVAANESTDPATLHDIAARGTEKLADIVCDNPSFAPYLEEHHPDLVGFPGPWVREALYPKP